MLSGSVIIQREIARTEDLVAEQAALVMDLEMSGQPSTHVRTTLKLARLRLKKLRLGQGPRFERPPAGLGFA